MSRLTLRRAAHALALAVAASSSSAQMAPAHIPLSRGLAFVQTLHMPEGDRESLITVDDSSSRGVSYTWRLLEVHAPGDTVRDTLVRIVSANDLASAPRWLDWTDRWDPAHAGYTSFSLSSAVYQQLATDGIVPFQIRSLGYATEIGAGAVGLPTDQVAVWRGTLTRTPNATEPFPILLNGRRTQVPALHARGQFSARGSKSWNIEFWVLADSMHPLLLKILFPEARHVLQTIRVDLGVASSAMLEHGLGSECRVEVPGIYFAFNSAALDPTSDRTLASVATVLGRHPDWSVTIEGHTDSIGTPQSNRTLSEQRAEAVRDALVRHRVPAARVLTAGYGASRPREPNATIEGRARNRRVELVRACGGKDK